MAPPCSGAGNILPQSHSAGNSFGKEMAGIFTFGTQPIDSFNRVAMETACTLEEVPSIPALASRPALSASCPAPL